MKYTLIAIGLLATVSQVSPAFGRGGVIHSIHASSSSGQGVLPPQRAINRLISPRKHDRLFVAQVRTKQRAARWHCVRYVMAITKKRFSLPNCTKRTAHS